MRRLLLLLRLPCLLLLLLPTEVRPRRGAREAGDLPPPAAPAPAGSCPRSAPRCGGRAVGGAGVWMGLGLCALAVPPGEGRGGCGVARRGRRAPGAGSWWDLRDCGLPRCAPSALRGSEPRPAPPRWPLLAACRGEVARQEPVVQQRGSSPHGAAPVVYVAKGCFRWSRDGSWLPTDTAACPPHVAAG